MSTINITAGTKIACRIAVPEPHATRARYALEALLVPLGLDPVWSGTPRIVYGPFPEWEEAGVVQMTSAPSAAEFLANGRRPYARSQAAAVRWENEEWPALFVDERGEADLVASAFILLSGWHEAAVEMRDEHGRVPFEATVPGLLNIGERPVVDAYRAILGARLRSAGIPARRRSWGGQSWAFCPTHDVDYLRKGRPGIWYREVVDRLLLNRRDESASQRLTHFRGFIRQIAAGDPYRRAFTRMIHEVAVSGGTATYFVKAGAEDPHDVAYSLTNAFLRRRLEDLRRHDFEVALHPSYRAVDDREMLIMERDRLSAVASSKLRSVRQHYLRYDPEATPRLHAEAGFAIDSTVGFADRPGFRRGTCLPHRLYDLISDRPLDIWEMPLTIMESALFNRQGMTADEAVEKTLELTATCRRFGGACVVLWHNTLWDELDCPGWGEHFTRTLRLAAEGGALMASLESALRAWR